MLLFAIGTLAQKQELPATSDTIAVSRNTVPMHDTSAGNSDNVPELDRMTVTGNRFGKEMATAQSIAILRPQEWIGTGRELADILASQSGVQTRRFGGRGSFQTVSIRGAESEEVLVLLDGIPLNSPMGNSVDLGKISSLWLGSVEIYRGIVPARFGGNSLGGVINLRSRGQDGTGNGSGGVHAMIGSYGTEEFAVSMASRPDSSVTILAELQFERSDNTFPYLDRNNTVLGTADDPTRDDTIRTMRNDDYTSGSFLVHPLVRLPGGGTLFSNIQASYARAAQPAPEGKTNVTALYEEKKLTASTRFEPHEPLANLQLIPGAGISWCRGRRFVSSIDESAGASHATLTAPDSYREIETTEKSIILPLLLQWTPLNRVAVEARIAADAADIAPLQVHGDASHGNWHSREATLDAATDATGTFGRASARFSIGGKAIASGTDGGMDAFSQRTIQAMDTMTNIWSAGGGVSMQLYNDALLVFANGGRYSNQPTLQQRYGARGAYNPNPDLHPEYGYKGEFGAKYAGSCVYLELCGFYSRIREKILTVFDGRQMAAVNCSGARMYGIETAVKWHVKRIVEGESAVTLQQTQNLTHEYNWYGRRLPNEPDLTITETFAVRPFESLLLQYGIDLKSFYYRTPANNRWSDRVPKINSDGSADFFEIHHNALLKWKAAKRCSLMLSAVNCTGKLLTQGELAAVGEGDYSWILYPANQFYLTAEYAF